MVNVSVCWSILNILVINSLEKSFNKEVAFDLYSRLLKDRIIFVSGEITDESANIIVSELLYLDSLSHDEINLYINSPGGSISAGMAIFDTMNFIESDVRTTVIGMAASMAAILASNGTKGKRCILENSEVMIHQPLGGVQGQATEINIVANRILKLRQKLNKILAKNTGQKLSKIETDTERDTYLSSIEAKKYGLIDIIL